MNNAPTLADIINRSNVRPIPHVRKVERGSADLDWTPAAMPLYTCPGEHGGACGDDYVRAGEAFAICRPGMERWPLGIASDHYKPTSHKAVDERVMAECSASIAPNGIVISGHGYQVAYGYVLRHAQASRAAGHEVTTKLVISHDHTGSGSMRASMCLYLDGRAIGAIVKTSAMHVAAQPGIWQANIDAMIESAIIAQDAVLGLIEAAAARKLTGEDLVFLKKKGLSLPKGLEIKTALGALVAHHAGRTKKVTWGVWERRMGDEGIRAVLSLLDPGIARELDEVLRSRRLSCVPARFSRAA